jgi:hypothetical protein
MKQAIDTFTADMFGEGNSHGGKTKATYEFYVRSADNNETRWTGLTKTKAQQMHAYTEQSQPSNVVSFGWELRA